MELESVKLYRLPLRSGVAGYRPSTDDDFGRRIMHRLKNVERQEEKESASVEIRLKRHLVIKFEIRLKNDIEDNSRAIAIVVWLLQQLELVSPTFRHEKGFIMSDGLNSHKSNIIVTQGTF